MLDKLNFSFFRKVPLVLQTESAECGLACLAMIAGFYGGESNLFQLRSKYGISSKGATLKNLIDIAQDLKLITRPLSLELDELKLLRLPCILHWDFNHFVVLTKVKDKSVVIFDPAFGKKNISFAECSKHFTGVALEAWSEVKFEKSNDNEKISLYETFKNISGIKGALLKIFSLSLLIELIALLMPIGTQLVIDHVLKAKDQSLLLIICLGLFLFTLFRSAVSMSRAWISLKMNYLIDFQWTSSFFSHLLKLPLDFFEKRQVGDIQSRFDSLRKIQNTLTNSIVTTIIDLIMTISVTIMMLLYGGWLTWVVITFSIIYLILRFVTYFTYRQITEEQIIKSAKSTSHFMETLYGIATIKSLGLNKKREEYWMSLNADAFNTSIRVTKLDMLFSGIHTFISTLEQILILWIGATIVMDNMMTVGMFMAFNSYRGSFSSRMGNLINIFFNFKMLSLHRERIADIALTEIENSIHSSPFSLSEEQKGLSILVKNLTFQYDQFTQPILDNLNLEVNAGESIAISAKSGAGKTTLLKLMSGLLRPTKGEIYINNIDIKNLDSSHYRQHIATVLQEDKFFSGSILENIVCFDNQYDKEFAI